MVKYRVNFVFFYLTCSSPENETETDQRQANKKQMEKDQVSETFLLVVFPSPVCLLWLIIGIIFPSVARWSTWGISQTTKRKNSAQFSGYWWVWKCLWTVWSIKPKTRIFLLLSDIVIQNLLKSILNFEIKMRNFSCFVLGHVDAGKSTLMGHLLYRLGDVSKKAMHKYP